MTTVTNAQYPYSVNARSGNLWRRYLLEKISHSDRLLGSEDREMPRSFPANCSSSVFSHLCKQYICPKHLEHRYGNRCPISIIPFLWTKSDGVVEDIMYRFLGFSNTKSTTLSTARAFHHHLDNAIFLSRGCLLILVFTVLQIRESISPWISLQMDSWWRWETSRRIRFDPFVACADPT